ncbi:DddA-like double-stranded DNA deaminase toxin [Actinokineospora sp.]|uniref:DddA-like double-stranded DNA deaminase toxin n=1 Tax=Actinokineospora sp. TaxID=1872133 RepID=UPI004037ABCD
MLQIVALKPAGKTLSSLTGIVVMAAVLWALLNFGYAPSCGRFSCSYVPSWWPQAHADSGGGSCPDNITAAANDAEWAADQIKSLRESDAKVTTGVFYEPDGTKHTYRSGYDGHSDRAEKALRAAGVDFPPAGQHPAAAHVETKIAAIMRENNITYGVAVINNERGPCGADPTSERRFSCGVAVPAILPEGSTLAVWFPGAVESVKLRGQA